MVSRRHKSLKLVWSRLLPVSMRVSNGISCLLSRNIWFAGVKQEDDGEKVARIPKIRRKWVYFHDKKSLILFLEGQNWPKTPKNWNNKVFHSIRYTNRALTLKSHFLIMNLWQKSWFLWHFMTVWLKIYDKFMTFWLKFMTIYDNIHETTKNSVTKIR